MAKTQIEKISADSPFFALDYQVVGESYVHDGKKRVALADSDKVADWIGKLPEEAIIVTELGGATDGPVLEMAGRGLVVYYVPTTYEEKARKEYGISGRKRDSEVLYRMFHDPKWHPLFYKHATDIDPDIIALSQVYATYTGLISDRVAMQNRITATYRRAAWTARQPKQKIEDYVKAACASNPAFIASTEEEKQYKAEIEKLVREMELFQKVLQPITGIGERIAAGLITGVKYASRFFPPNQPDAMLGAKKRVGEYAGLDGDAITAELLVRRRASGQRDIGVPQLKSDLYLLVSQLHRRQDETPVKSMLNWRKLKEQHTMLDELLNSPERAATVFLSSDKDNDNEKTVNAQKIVARVRPLANERAWHKAKEVFFVHYFFPAMYVWETGQLPDDFDANAELDALMLERIGRDQELVRKHQVLRLARLPYKLAPKGGKTAFGDWLTICELDSPSGIPNAEQKREIAVEQMQVDINAQIEDIKAKLNGDKECVHGEDNTHLSAALGRRVQALDALEQGTLKKLSAFGKQLVWETRGIGQPICDFVDEQAPILAEQLQGLERQEHSAQAPIEAEIEKLKQARDQAEQKSSELQAELRRAQRRKNHGEIAAAEIAIAETNLPKKIAQIRQAIKEQKALLKESKKDFDNKRQNLLNKFKPDMAAILDRDPRLQNREKWERPCIETLIRAMIQHRALKGFLTI